MRAQISSIDLVLALIVFSLLFVFFVGSWSSTVSSAKNAMKKNRMEYAALSATDLLLKSPGSGSAGSAGGFAADFYDPFDSLGSWSAGGGGNWVANGVAYSSDTWESNLYRSGAYSNDYQVLAKVQFNSGLGGGPVIQGGSAGLNGYACRLVGTGLQLTQLSGGAAWAIPGASYLGTVTPGSWYYVKANASGSTKQCKYWAVGSSEPSGWQVTGSDSLFTSGAYYGVYGKAGVQFDDFQQGRTTASSGNSTLSSAGFASSPYELSAAKIAQFTALNYSVQKSLLGMQEEFYFYVDTAGGTRLYEGGNLTVKSRGIVSITRYGMLNGNKVKIGMMVYG